MDGINGFREDEYQWSETEISEFEQNWYIKTGYDQVLEIAGLHAGNQVPYSESKGARFWPLNRRHLIDVEVMERMLFRDITIRL
jgi:hypothetical protein